MDQMDPNQKKNKKGKKKENERENCGCTERFISRNGLREGIRHSWERPRRGNPKHNTQQVNTIINYILFYGTKLGLWVMGSSFFPLLSVWWGKKRKKEKAWMDVLRFIDRKSASAKEDLLPSDVSFFCVSLIVTPKTFSLPSKKPPPSPSFHLCFPPLSLTLEILCLDGFTLAFSPPLPVIIAAVFLPPLAHNKKIVSLFVSPLLIKDLTSLFLINFPKWKNYRLSRCRK